MQCCGVSNFTDYIDIFMNNTVPHSCCNITAAGTSCPEIVLNALEANQTGLLYSQVLIV